MTNERGARRRMAASLFSAVVLFGAACSGGGGAAQREEGVLDPAAAIQDFDADPAAGSWPRSRLNTAVFSQPQASREAALEALRSDDADARIAAVYALSLTVQPEDADVLAPLLRSQEPGESVLAATGMISIGDGRAVAVLIESLGIDDPLPFGRPPLRVWEQARSALLSFTGQDLGLQDAATARGAAATTPEWKAWWADAEDSFEVVRSPRRFGS